MKVDELKEEVEVGVMMMAGEESEVVEVLKVEVMVVEVVQGVEAGKEEVLRIVTVSY